MTHLRGIAAAFVVGGGGAVDRVLVAVHVEGVTPVPRREKHGLDGAERLASPDRRVLEGLSHAPAAAAAAAAAPRRRRADRLRVAAVAAVVRGAAVPVAHVGEQVENRRPPPVFARTMTGRKEGRKENTWLKRENSEQEKSSAFLGTNFSTNLRTGHNTAATAVAGEGKEEEEDVRVPRTACPRGVDGSSPLVLVSVAVVGVVVERGGGPPGELPLPAPDPARVHPDRPILVTIRRLEERFPAKRNREKVTAHKAQVRGRVGGGGCTTTPKCSVAARSR